MEDDVSSSVYHEGEITVQRRAGVRERAEQLSGMVERTVPASNDVRALASLMRSSRQLTAMAQCGSRF